MINKNQFIKQKVNRSIINRKLKYLLSFGFWSIDLFVLFYLSFNDDYLLVIGFQEASKQANEQSLQPPVFTQRY